MEDCTDREATSQGGGPGGSGPRASDLPLFDEFRIEPQMIPQISGDQEILPHSVATGPTHGLASIRVAKELDGTVSGFLHRGHEESVASILNLDSDADHVPTDHRNALPEGLAHDESEPLPEGFRQCDVCLSLEYVHLDRADAAEVGQKVDVRIVARMPCRPLEPQPAFGVVLCHGGDHQQLDVGKGSLHQSVRVDDTERVLPRVEAAHLTDHTPGRVELEPREDGLPFTLVDISIFRTQRIDRGR